MTTEAELAIVVPTRGRARLLHDLIANIRVTTPDVYELYFVVDSDDGETAAVLADEMDEHIRVIVVAERATLPVKSNVALAVTDHPLVFIANDDVKFHDDWYPAVKQEFRRTDAGVVGTNDLHNPDVCEGNMATQFLITRAYIERGGAGEQVLFHEGYHHNFIDTELCWVAQIRGSYAHAHDSIVEHVHPDWGLREPDETDRIGGRMNGEQDEALFTARIDMFSEHPELWQ